MPPTKPTRPRHRRAAAPPPDAPRPPDAADPAARRRRGLERKELGREHAPEQAPPAGALLLPRLRVERANPGHLHPAGRDDVLELLAFLGPAGLYGLRSVSLLRRRGERPRL